MTGSYGNESKSWLNPQGTRGGRMLALRVCPLPYNDCKGVDWSLELRDRCKVQSSPRLVAGLPEVSSWERPRWGLSRILLRWYQRSWWVALSG